MLKVDAMFVDPKGIYPKLLGPEHCWDEARDARTYDGPGPVVAHPPCARWSRLAVSVFSRTKRPEHLPGNDGGCFASALASVRRCGGVLEHPAETRAWVAHGLCPIRASDGIGWIAAYEEGCSGGDPVRNPPTYWVCEVWQSAYGHRARKRTWLLYCGARPPFELDWRREPGTHVVGGDSTKRAAIVAAGGAVLPRLSARENLATPEAFARELICLAEWSKSC
jgi:hypothetical protein